MSEVKTCTGPKCTNAPKIKGLCPTHYRQQLRGKELTEIREVGEALVVYSVRLPAHIAEALNAQPDKVRVVLTQAVDEGVL